MLNSSHALLEEPIDANFFNEIDPIIMLGCLTDQSLFPVWCILIMTEKWHE